jgi:response regulator RpfG family c-di-GMP phosphodiesterase
MSSSLAVIAGRPRKVDQRPVLLFVDDEERILRSLKLLFGRDYRVLVTTNGRDALAMLRQQKVHVLVCDQRMPNMSGVEVLREARAISPDTMRLLLTGYADAEAVVGCINEGEIFRYLSKPWQSEQIRSTVASASAIAVALEQAPGCKTPPQPVGPAQVGILLIDTHAETADAVRGILDQHLAGGFDFEWADSLDGAMAVLEKRDIGVILSELRIGNQDAMPFLKALKRLHPHVVTIVLSSIQDIRTLVDLVNQGQIHRFLPKPVRTNMTVRSLLSGVQLHHNMRRQPRLLERHRVEVPMQDAQDGFIGRLRQLVRRVTTSQ